MSLLRNPARIDRYRSIIALLLIVPVTSIDALCSTMIAPGGIGQGIAVGCGVWLLVFPLLWQVSIERQPLGWRLAPDGWRVGIILGALMFGTIFASYWFGGRYLLNNT